LALGAIGPGGIEIISSDLARRMRIQPQQIEAIAARERLELDRRESAYRGTRPPIGVHGETVILVDDGLATGATMRAAVAALRLLGQARIVVAIPVAAASVCQQIAGEADKIVCLHSPVDLDSVGQWYEDFSQTSDAEVCD